MTGVSLRWQTATTSYNMDFKTNAGLRCGCMQDVIVRGNFALGTTGNVAVFRGTAPNIVGTTGFIWQVITYLPALLPEEPGCRYPATGVVAGHPGAAASWCAQQRCAQLWCTSRHPFPHAPCTQAVDPIFAQNMITLKNEAAGAISSLHFAVEAWVGSYATSGALPAGQLVTGTQQRRSASPDSQLRFPHACTASFPGSTCCAPNGALPPGSPPLLRETGPCRRLRRAEVGVQPGRVVGVQLVQHDR